MTAAKNSPGRHLRAVATLSTSNSNHDDPDAPYTAAVETGVELSNANSVVNLGASYDDEDNAPGSNFDPEAPPKLNRKASIKATLESEKYDAATIRQEFRRYQALLPNPDKLLQEQHSVPLLRKRIEDSGVELPRFLKHGFEGGIKPHHALCCLLLGEHQAEEARKKTKCCPSLWYILSGGKLDSQIKDPADFIRDQFQRVAHAIPTEVVSPDVLRKKIRNLGLPIPNYFLDPEDGKQFPPHIALLVLLQDGEKESEKFDAIIPRVAFSVFAFVALLLRIVLEVIGGAGAIWGGSEVFTLRTAANAEPWRWFSVSVGILCFLRLLTLNAPQMEDEGDILGPAGPWSLRLPVRLRAVCDHPFHYFVRALPPSSTGKKHD